MKSAGFEAFFEDFFETIVKVRSLKKVQIVNFHFVV